MGHPTTFDPTATLQGAYNRSGPAPHIVTDAAVGPVTIQTGVPATDILRLRNSAGAVQHSWQETSVTLGPLVTDIFAGSLTGVNFAPSLFPTRPTLNINLDSLTFLNSDRTFTAIPGGGGLFNITNTFILNFVNSTLGAFVRFSPVIQYQQNANPFGMGLLFNAAAIFENLSTTTSTMSNALSFVGQNTYRANTLASSIAQMSDHLSQPVFDAVNGATFTMSGTFRHFAAAGQLRAGVTLNGTRVCFEARDWATFTGTMSATARNIGLDIGDLSFGAGEAYGIRSVMTANASRRFIEHTGTAISNFGGNIVLTGAALLDFSTLNALGGGAAATLGTIGGSGPTVAAQNTWIRVQSGGTLYWIPAWV